MHITDIKPQNVFFPMKKLIKTHIVLLIKHVSLSMKEDRVMRVVVTNVCFHTLGLL